MQACTYKAALDGGQGPCAHTRTRCVALSLGKQLSNYPLPGRNAISPCTALLSHEWLGEATPGTRDHRLTALGSHQGGMQTV